MAARNIVMDQLGLFHGEDGRVILCCCYYPKFGKSLKKLVSAGWHGGLWSQKTRRLNLLLHLRQAWAIRRATSLVFFRLCYYAQRA
jgi:hypothetical protein